MLSIAIAYLENLVQLEEDYNNKKRNGKEKIELGSYLSILESLKLISGGEEEPTFKEIRNS